MDVQRWQQIRLLFEEAVAQPAALRGGFLDAAAAGDAGLRREVWQLLSADSDSETLLTDSADDLISGLLDPPEQHPADIGPYRVIRTLGRGGMGNVYLARHQEGRFDGEVAVKVLRRGMDSEDILRRFRTEGMILARLDHAGIARFLHAGITVDGQPFLVIEYVDGAPITSYCDARNLDVTGRLRLFQDVCGAVQEAHEHGIIHRDLKPSNVVVTGEGEVKLLDFGIAKMLEPGLLRGAGARTRTGFRVLTPAYASPEQIRGTEVGSRSDVYALGALLYELLSGHCAQQFQGMDWAQIERVICEQAPPPPSVAAGKTEEAADAEGGDPPVTPGSVAAARSTTATALRRELRGPLDRLVMMALRKEPQRRYASVVDLSDDVGRYLNGRPVRARRAGGSYRLGIFARRHRTGLAGTLALVTVVGGAGAVATALLRSSGAETVSTPAAAAQPTMVAVVPFAHRGPAGRSYVTDGVSDAITAALAAFPELEVIARSSADRYRGTGKTPAEIGRELGAAYILEGSVDFTKSPEGSSRMRVTPRLIRVSDNTSVWSARYDEDVANIFKVEAAIAQKIARSLDLRPETRRAAPATPPTRNLQAYTYYLRGNEFGRFEEDAENLLRAASMYEQALALDPGFARAHARLSVIDIRLWFYYFDRTAARFEAAREHAETALILDPTLPDSYFALGMYYYLGKEDYVQAQQHFERTLALQSNSPQALRGMGWVLRRRGQLREALGYFERLDRLDPFGSDVLAIAFSRQLLRDYPAADRAYSRVLERAPETPLLHALRGRMLVAWTGDIRKAQRVLDEGEGSSVDNDYTRATAVEFDLMAGDNQGALDRLEAMRQEVLESQIFYAPTAYLKARAYRAMGDGPKARPLEEEARKLLEAQLEAQPADARTHATLGRVYASLGRTDDAIRAGRRAVELMPMHKDAIKGPVFVADLAAIYTMTGRYDEAIDQLEVLLASPGLLSPASLRVDRSWDALRREPRFQALIQRGG